jgi:hypothetical protein
MLSLHCLPYLVFHYEENQKKTENQKTIKPLFRFFFLSCFVFSDFSPQLTTFISFGNQFYETYLLKPNIEFRRSGLSWLWDFDTPTRSNLSWAMPLSLQGFLA